jgi:cytoskeleton protein RodZ
MIDPERNENISSGVSEEVPPASPGAQLTAQRQALGWSVDQVANQLNLAPRQIIALEENNYAALPGMVIARGFLRAYAKLLKMDPASLLSLVREENAPTAESIELRRALSASFSESSLPPATGNRPRYRRLFWTLILVLAIVIGWLGYQNKWFPGFSGIAGTTVGKIRQNIAPAPTVSNPVSTSSPEPMKRVPEVQTPENGNGTNDQPVVVPENPVLTAPEVAAAMPENKTEVSLSDKLVLAIRQDSWIEVRRASDKTVLLSKLLPSGSTETFDLSQPIVLIIGNAAGVDATLRGKPLELKSTAKNNVVRLDLK